MKTDYNLASVTYDNTRNANSPIIELLSSRFDFDSTSKILDFGCGTGNYLYQLSQIHPGDFYGLEPSEGMRNIAREKNKTAVIVSGNHEYIPFDDELFDLIYMTDVIHHVPDLSKLFSSLYRKLKQGGLVCILTESHEQINSRWYNIYFESLYQNEINRYPDVACIIKSAEEQGFVKFTIDILNHGNEHIVTHDFIRMAEEKNYSMFRQLDHDEYAKGLMNLKGDINLKIMSREHGESLIWLKKPFVPK